MAGLTERGAESPNTERTSPTSGLSATLDDDVSRRNPRLANWVSAIHLTYCVVGIIICLLPFALLPYIVRITIIAWAWYIPVIVCRFYWNACPLSLAEHALRDGKDFDTNKSWMSLRKSLSFDEVVRLSFVQPVVIWAIAVTLGVAISVIL